MNSTSFLLIIFCCIFLAACKGEKQYHDEHSDLQIENDILAEAIKFQQETNKLFRDPESSPLPDRFRKNFKGLDFYQPDSNYRVKAILRRTPNALPFKMPTTTGRTIDERLFGIAEFLLNNQSYQLEVYQAAETESEETTLFIPFLDLTNGVETYTGGRYLDVEIPLGDTLIIDFNMAYNPYCAYNPKYSCPVVPKVNALDIAIKAGVKDFKEKP